MTISFAISHAVFVLSPANFEDIINETNISTQSQEKKE